MPRYDYRCDANGRTVEVSHGMEEGVGTWGELCGRAGIDPGRTPADAPVEKAVSLSFSRTGKESRPGPNGGTSGGSCGVGCGCHPQ